MNPREELVRYVQTTRLDASEVAARTSRIHAAVLAKSKFLDGPNFTRIHASDLELLFDEYDAVFFDGRIRRALGDTPLGFELSRRMTSAGGRTRQRQHLKTGLIDYEISAATSVLFECFRDDDHRPITASGIICRDRLDALERVMEHETTHLIEFLGWNETSCSRARFHSITRNLFGHTENRHNLITPRERIVVKYGIKPGMKVRFRFDGVEHVGLVNRINKRATVLVEDPSGPRYSNGKNYLKFYVPAGALTPVE